MKTELWQKYERLQKIVSGFKAVLVAYSGGLDSAFLLYAAVQTLGVAGVQAVTADSPSYPRRELEQARAFAQSLGLGDKHRIIQTAELDNPDYAANPLDRCFYCKQELYSLLTAPQLFGEVEAVLDGFNADDVGDFRPGRKAAEIFKIRSPLFEAGLGKAEIRELARHFGLKIWDKPQMACLSSRIPYGSPVTIEKLGQVEKAEEYLRSLGFTQLRVRHHDLLARIELPLEDIQKIYENNLHDKVCAEFRRIGFVWVTLDLGGFRSGSMNEALDGSDKDV